MRQATVMAEGLIFGEGPRWRDDKLWLSDFGRTAVFTVDLIGTVETVVEVENRPSGLGWLPDGTMLIVSMRDRRVLRFESGDLREHADLSGIAGGHCNDMVVDQHGRAYVGNLGFDMLSYTGQPLLIPQLRADPNFLLADKNLPTATLALIEPDGTVSPAADGLRFPNGCVITPDGSTLILSETLDPCLTAFDIAQDGSLSNRRVWAQFPKQWPTTFPDGICLDAENCVWVSSPLSNECIRVREGGEVVDRVAATGPIYACMLGGPDRRTLFLIVNHTIDPDNRECTIEATEVVIPGAGWP